MPICIHLSNKRCESEEPHVQEKPWINIHLKDDTHLIKQYNQLNNPNKYQPLAFWRWNVSLTQHKKILDSSIKYKTSSMNKSINPKIQTCKQHEQHNLAEEYSNLNCYSLFSIEIHCLSYID